MKRITILILLLVPILLLHGRGEQEEGLTILYTSSLNGNLDGCECKSRPRAGLVKRAAYLRAWKNWERTILVDTGDILDVYADNLLAREILEVYRELNYSAIAVGDQELSNGIAELIKYKDKYPLISHNLTLCPDEIRCIFFSSSPLIISRKSFRIGLFALIDPEVFYLYPEEIRKSLKITPPLVTAENMVKNLHDEGVNLIILLYHGSYENASSLIREVKSIQVLILGHEQRLIEAEKIGETILVSPGEEGNRIGILQLSINQKGITDYSNKFRLFKWEADEDDPGVRKRIENYRQLLREKLKKR